MDAFLFKNIKEKVRKYNWTISNNFSDEQLEKIFLLTAEHKKPFVSDLDIFSDITVYINAKLSFYADPVQGVQTKIYYNDILKLLTQDDKTCDLRFILCNEFEMLNIKAAYKFLSDHKSEENFVRVIFDLLNKRQETDLYDLSTIVNVYNNYSELPFIKNFPLSEKIVLSLSYFTEIGKNYASGFNYELNKDIIKDIYNKNFETFSLQNIYKIYEKVLNSSFNILVDLNEDKYNEEFKDKIKEVFTEVLLEKLCNNELDPLGSACNWIENELESNIVLTQRMTDIIFSKLSDRLLLSTLQKVLLSKALEQQESQNPSL